MPSTSPASSDQRIGQAKADLDTPALLLDLGRFERNIERLSSTIAAGGKAWRPHSKGHKSPWVAQRQMAAGAIGVTCAKISEAEVMVDGGVPSILVANSLATKTKLRNAARLQARAEVMITADDPYHVRLASEVAVETGVELPMVVDVNVGMDRTGVMPGQPALELARAIDRAKGLRLAGIMGYEGHVLMAWPSEEKESQSVAALAGLIESRKLIEADGMPVGIVSGGGSGNHMFAAAHEGLTELQAGGACLMDPFYAELCHLAELGFEYALTVLTTVTSRPTPERVLTDGGFKTMSAKEEWRAIVVDHEELAFGYLSAEHGMWLRPPDGPTIAIGDQLEIIPDYHDTTTFRHDAFLGLRDGVVETVIPLLARGKLT